MATNLGDPVTARPTADQAIPKNPMTTAMTFGAGKPQTARIGATANTGVNVIAGGYYYGRTDAALLTSYPCAYTELCNYIRLLQSKYNYSFQVAVSDKFVDGEDWVMAYVGGVSAKERNKVPTLNIVRRLIIGSDLRWDLFGVSDRAVSSPDLLGVRNPLQRKSDVLQLLDKLVDRDAWCAGVLGGSGHDVRMSLTVAETEKLLAARNLWPFKSNKNRLRYIVDALVDDYEAPNCFEESRKSLHKLNLWLDNEVKFGERIRDSQLDGLVFVGKGCFSKDCRGLSNEKQCGSCKSLRRKALSKENRAKTAKKKGQKDMKDGKRKKGAFDDDDLKDGSGTDPSGKPKRKREKNIHLMSRAELEAAYKKAKKANVNRKHYKARKAKERLEAQKGIKQNRVGTARDLRPPPPPPPFRSGHHAPLPPHRTHY
mmetsp:Transcript_1647/g.2060  ORF Transcript_1647/g.2060 Transcript_1647/m.2060 type:complete len:427 (+) Transcript_1647:142-1422(+)|eukprot:jgi/Bigna1/91230/estExt_fgenesh1_pg.C_930060